MVRNAGQMADAYLYVNVYEQVKNTMPIKQVILLISPHAT